MEEAKKNFLVLTTLCALIFQVTARLHPAVPSFEKEIKAEFLDARNVFRDKTGIYYATVNYTCGEPNYVVTQEMPIAKDFVYKKSCEVKKRDIKTHNNFVPLNRETVLMVSHNYKSGPGIIFTSVNIFVVQMNTCQVRQVSFYNLTSMTQVYAGNDNHFDVLYTTTNFTEGLDCLKNVCKVRFDHNGVQIDKPRQHMKRIDLVYPNFTISLLVPLRVSQTPKSPSLHYSLTQVMDSFEKISESNQMINFHNFLGMKHDKRWTMDERITKVDAQGISTDLLFRHNISSFSQISYVNDGISLCYLSQDSLICQQYDYEAKLRINESLKFSDYSIDPQNVLFIPYNLPEDRGMILSIAELKREVNTVRYRIEKYKILAITSQEGPKFPIEIDNRNQSISCSIYGAFTTFNMPSSNVVLDGSDICLQHFCLKNSSGPMNLRYTTKCFPKDILGV